MPLEHSASPGAFKTNVRTLMHEVGKSPHVQSREQALAIAYATQRRAGHHAEGGPVAGFALGGAPAPWQTRAEARGMLHTGPILSAVPGRTDRHNMAVPSGSYVVPAQAVSHLGQSNTLAGMKVLNTMFGHGGPYGGGEMPISHGRGVPGAPKPLAPLASGGMTDQGGARESAQGEPVDVVTAGGEYIIEPASVAKVGGGDIKHGHNVLDAWVNSILDDHIRTLKKLPPPAKS